MDNYDKITINCHQLEAEARIGLVSGKLSVDQAFAYSQAISLKRISDMMRKDREEQK